MINVSTSLAGNSERRRIIMSPSSGGALGLQPTDIIRQGLTGVDNVRTGQAPFQPPSLAERVFAALATAKIWTSKVAMHLDLEARDRFFRQLDLLHDCDEWFGNDQPVALESYKSFIRFMLVDGRCSVPSLALAANGHLLAVWENRGDDPTEAPGDRLTVEFMVNGDVQWVVSRKEGERIERAAGVTSVERLRSNIAPYHPEGWFKFG